MTIKICGVCDGFIREINDGSDKIEKGYDGCEEDKYDEEKR